MDKMSASLHISANAHIVILQAYDRACDLTRSGLTSTTPLDDGNAMRKAVQRHSELTPLRHEELTPMPIAFRRLRIAASQWPFAKGRCDAFRGADSCLHGW